MAIGRRYYYAAALFCASLYCASHYDAKYPERGWRPWSQFGNRWKAKKRDEEAAAAKAAEKADREERRRRREERRRDEHHQQRPAMIAENMATEQSTGVRSLDSARGQGKAEMVGGKAGKAKRKGADGGEDDEMAVDGSSPEVKPPKKRLRIETNLDVTYDSTGTPRFATLPSAAGTWSNEYLPAASSHQSAREALPRLDTSSSSLRLNVQVPNQQQNTGLVTALGRATLLSAQPSKLQHSAIPSLSSATFKQEGFSLLESLCRNNAVLLHLVSFLTIPSLLTLYSVSKRFHALLNRHYTAFVLAIMRTWAPGADKIFPWRCYRALCVKDPFGNEKVRLEGKPQPEWQKMPLSMRDVPSLKWLQMVVWREGVTQDILIQMRVKGLRCRPGTLEAVKKIWFIMDLPLNAHRIALMRSMEYITPIVLENMTQFMIKVDMFFTDPLQFSYPLNHPNQRMFPAKWGGKAPSGVALREMLLAERQLSSLWRVIRGWSWDATKSQRPMTRMDALRLWVRHAFKFPEGTPEDVKKESIMGIPWYEVGTAGLERTGISYYDLAPEIKKDGEEADGQNSRPQRVMLTHPSFGTNNPQAAANNHPLYPQARRLHLVYEKPREPLLRPDQLVVREAIRRKTYMHTKWVEMMLYGFCTRIGWDYPLETEEEILQKLRGVKISNAGPSKPISNLRGFSGSTPTVTQTPGYAAGGSSQGGMAYVLPQAASPDDEQVNQMFAQQDDEDEEDTDEDDDEDSDEDMGIEDDDDDEYA